jgi:hypothetical protein
LAFLQCALASSKNSNTLKDANWNELSLTTTNEGIFYNYLKSIIEESLNNFLSDISFPYTQSSSNNGGGPGGNFQVNEVLHQMETFLTII